MDFEKKEQKKETTPRCRSSVGTNSKIESYVSQWLVCMFHMNHWYELTERIQRSISVLMRSV